MGASLPTMGSEANAKAVLAEKAKAKAASKKRNQQVVYYGAFAAVMLLMAWMVFESMTGEAPKRRQRAATRQSSVANEDPSPPGPDVLARVAIKTDEGGSQIFLDVKHQLDDLEGIQGDVDVHGQMGRASNIQGTAFECGAGRAETAAGAASG